MTWERSRVRSSPPPPKNPLVLASGFSFVCFVYLKEIFVFSKPLINAKPRISPAAP